MNKRLIMSTIIIQKTMDIACFSTAGKVYLIIKFNHCTGLSNGGLSNRR